MGITYYGLCVGLGIIAAVMVGELMLKRFTLSQDAFVLLLAYGGGGSLLGAKILYLLVNIHRINWRVMNMEYFKTIMQGGFVFYGGLIGGIIAAVLGAKIHHINVLPYMEAVSPCLFLGHAIGRIGCYLEGCCYGIPYNGPACVMYTESVAAPTGITLFPVQLLEAAIELFLFWVLLRFVLKKGLRVETPIFYGLGYSVLRFITEFFRFDYAERGMFGVFSISQWISLICITGLTILSGWLLMRQLNFNKHR